MLKHCYSINASLMSVLKQYIRIHYMQIVFIFFLMLNSQLIILSLLREDDENDTMIFTVCFWMNPADEVQELFQFLNTGVIRKIIPRQPLWAKEVGVFFSFQKLKTLYHNLGQGSSLSWSECTTNGTKGVLTKQKTVMVLNNHKERQSLSQKWKPIKLKPMKETYKTGASRWL